MSVVGWSPEENGTTVEAEAGLKVKVMRDSSPVGN